MYGQLWVRVRAMVFNATFNNISVTSWQSVLLVEETGLESPKITSAAKKKPNKKQKGLNRTAYSQNQLRSPM